MGQGAFICFLALALSVPLALRIEPMNDQVVMFGAAPYTLDRLSEFRENMLKHIESNSQLSWRREQVRRRREGQSAFTTLVRAMNFWYNVSRTADDKAFRKVARAQYRGRRDRLGKAVAAGLL